MASTRGARLGGRLVCSPIDLETDGVLLHGQKGATCSPALVPAWALAYTIWMPRLDTAHEVTIPSPTVTEVVVTNPAIPGLELRIPPNTVIRDVDGKAVTKIGLTQILPDKPPFPLQPNVIDLPVYFTAQPGASYVENPTGAGVRVIYPNTRQRPPGWRGDFWHYDPGSRGWYVYGQGAVTANGSQIAPDPGVGIYELTGAMQGNQNLGSPTGATPGSARGAEPVDLSTGIFVYEKTDLTVADVIPLVLTRTYMHQDPRTLTFGRATTHNYDIFLVGDTNPYTFSQLILPDGGRLRYRRISAGTGFTDAIYEHSCPSTGTCTATPTAFYKSQIKWNGAGWDLALRDGTVYTFPDGAPATTPSQAALLRIRDRYGNTVQLTRDPTSKLLRRITSPKGRWIEFTYDGQNRIIQAMDNSGRSVLYSYDTQGRLVQVVDPKDGVTQYTYDASNRMATLTDARGIVYLTNAYDANSRISMQTQPDTTTWQLAYTLDQGKVIQTDLTDPRGFIRRLTFNSDGYTLTDIRALNQPEQQTTTYVRSASGQPGSNLISQVTDPLSRVTTYAYDAAGNAQTITRLPGTGDQVVSTLSYEAPFSYQPLSSGVFNRILTIVPSTATTDGQVTIGYTGLTRATITDARGKQTLIDYNAAGQPTAVTDPLIHITRFEYDPATADLTAIVDPLMNRAARTYDAVGRLVTQTDPRGQKTSFAYDVLNRLAAIGDAASGTTRFAYDPNGNLLSLTDARGNPSSYRYNTMDRVDQRTDPLGRLETFHYDNNGNLDDYTDRKTQRTTFTYDGLNRRTGASYLADVSTTSFQWDGGNRLMQVADSVGGTITNTWTQRDRLLSQQTSQGTVSYDQHDTLDRLTRMTPPAQPQIVYGYSPISQLSSVQQATQTVSLAYDDAGRRMSLTLPNTVATGYTYDNANRLTGLSYGPGGTLGTLGYSYDPASNRTSVSGTAASTLLPDAVSTSNYNAGNRQLGFGARTMIYDNNGNLGTLALGVDTTQFTWDQRNRLTGLTGPGLAASFIYDGLGRRTSKTINGVVSQFLYDNADILRETIDGTAIHYLRSLGIDEPFSRGGSEYYLHDALGSAVALTDRTGVVTTSYSYEPFGRTEATGAVSGNPFQYTGRENDTTGLHSYRARYYHPTLQRFISEDPIAFSGGDTNIYGYVGNSPVRWTDPLGLYPAWLHRRMAEGAARACGLSGSDLDALLQGVTAPDLEPSTLWPWSEKHSMPGTPWASYGYQQQASAIQLHRSGNRQLAFGTLGRGLHALEDSFVHDLGNPQGTMKLHVSIWVADIVIPYSAVWLGDPDDPRSNPIAYYAAQRATYDYIRDFMVARGIKPSCP
jgi:RHS repeat-associated protein